MSFFHCNALNIEVIDEYGYVLFNMRYEYPRIIINGYSVTDNRIVACQEDAFLSFIHKATTLNYRDTAIGFISRIQRLNSYLPR